MYQLFLCLFCITPFVNGQIGRSHITFRLGRGTIPVNRDEKTPLSRATLNRDEKGRILTDQDPVSIRKDSIFQRLDHFDGMNSRQWKQYYWVNDSYYKKGGPVFLMLTSGSMDQYWIEGGGQQPDWLAKAKKFNALAFLLEHRYYGKSQPTEKLTTTSLKYLNTYQVLSDIGHFIVNMKVKFELDNSPWVLFGCSYAGALAVWSRLKFPHLVKIAVASGAPLEAKLDFPEYAEEVTNSLKLESPECVDSIRNATQTMTNWTQSGEQLAKLKKLFNLCDDLDPTDKKNVSVFFASLAENIFNIVQYSRINSDGMKFNLTTSMICKTMSNPELGDYVDRYATVHRQFHAYHQFTCFSTSYNSLIAELRNVDYNSDWRQWTYQVCNEFGFYQTSNSPYQPFGNKFDLDYYMDQCTDAFGTGMQKKYVLRSIHETLHQYGGRNPEVTKTIITYGTADPWRPLIPSKSVQSMKVVPIEGTSHCADFYTPDDKTDPKALKDARRQVDKILARWLDLDNSGQGMHASKIYIFVLLLFSIILKSVIC